MVAMGASFLEASRPAARRRGHRNLSVGSVIRSMTSRAQQPEEEGIETVR